MTVNVVLEPAADRLDLLAAATAKALADLAAVLPLDQVSVGAIDPALADTAAFCAEYGVDLDETANCVVVAAKRAGQTTYAACLVRATTRADINGLTRRHLGARKISFAPMDDAVALTGMEYGGITPIGLPEGWPILIDDAVAAVPRVVVGSGVRGSKIWLPGSALTLLPGAVVLPGLGMVANGDAAAGSDASPGSDPQGA
ncbi:MAG TPA: YbaK/EbsC family protein [Actinocrinis sp.]|uniref:YbaK/EbsC family protein n=1 Tax=Actinocrinis sp. TaxID=1920516 RepID=UPI002DDCAC40|nr:YbaK/EbsC family protein [Actinocrinis sp.]HEV2342481.1 YbaK/EbsC family protein [Actinocrinis sp.]